MAPDTRSPPTRRLGSTTTKTRCPGRDNCTRSLYHLYVLRRMWCCEAHIVVSAPSHQHVVRDGVASATVWSTHGVKGHACVCPPCTGSCNLRMCLPTPSQRLTVGTIAPPMSSPSLVDHLLQEGEDGGDGEEVAEEQARMAQGTPRQTPITPVA
jgi:hypothetical protein